MTTPQRIWQQSEWPDFTWQECIVQPKLRAVHYQAPAREQVDTELDAFMCWFNQSLHDPLIDPITRAAITHLWFISIHPFADGNDRITRALTDRALAQADQHSIRLYAMSEAILEQRSQYYDVLEATQKSGWISPHGSVGFVMRC